MMLKGTPPLLEWERLIWSGRAGPFAGVSHLGERYLITDFRAVVLDRASLPQREIAIEDLASVDLTQSVFQRLRGRSTIVLGPTRSSETPLKLLDVRHGPQLALILQLLTADALRDELDEGFLASALGKRSSDPFGPNRGLVFALVTVILVVAMLVRESLPGGHPLATLRATTDVSSGRPGDRAAMMRLMEQDVMVFARRTLGPLKGGADRISCATCHGRDGAAHEWKMPAVQALPEPELRTAGLELYNADVDAQVRNAIYGYLAEEDNQGKAAYMRGVVLPGMASLLGRPPYDFTQSYDYNRSRGALGCYHCHQVTTGRNTPDH